VRISARKDPEGTECRGGRTFVGPVDRLTATKELVCVIGGKSCRSIRPIRNIKSGPGSGSLGGGVGKVLLPPGL